MFVLPVLCLEAADYTRGSAAGIARQVVVNREACGHT